MINIFRKARKQMMDGNKVVKYLVYALSEILLVVVGIMIALQIEGWKEDQENLEKTNVILFQMLDEIEHNIASGTNNIVGFNKKDSLMDLVLNRKVSYEDYESNTDFSSLIVSYYWLEFYQSAYGKLVAHSEKIDPAYDSLTKQIVHLYNTTMFRVEEDYLLVGNHVAEAVGHLKFNAPWYSSSLPQHEQEGIEFMLNDPIYMNLVKSFQTVAGGNYFYNVINFNQEAIVVYKEIHKKLKLDSHYPEEIARIIDLSEKELAQYEGTYISEDKSQELKVKEGYLRNDTLEDWIFFTCSDTAEYRYGIDQIIFKRDSLSNVIGFGYTYRGEHQVWKKVTH